MIKAIIFDNNGVLTFSDKEKTVANFAKYFKIDESELRKVFDDFAKPLDDGTITTYDFHKKIANHFGKDFNYKDLLKVHINSYQPKEGMRDFLLTLKKDYDIVLLTNFGDAFDDANKEVWSYDNLFDKDKLFVSCKMKMKKPDKDIYEACLKSLGLKPEETVFVDDRELNLKAPQELGMNVILFTEIDELKKDLSKLLNKKYV
ncbi:HAD-IA family hydrolase [bacterium]|nr:HAD-IA family hydrolase [bacterium]